MPQHHVNIKWIRRGPIPANARILPILRPSDPDDYIALRVPDLHIVCAEQLTMTPEIWQRNDAHRFRAKDRSGTAKEPELLGRHLHRLSRRIQQRDGSRCSTTVLRKLHIKFLLERFDPDWTTVTVTQRCERHVVRPLHLIPSQRPARDGL